MNIETASIPRQTVSGFWPKAWRDRLQQNDGWTRQDSPVVALSKLIDHGQRLRSLWLAYLLAMLFHVELGLMPLFHGQTAQIESAVDPNRLSLLFWGMLIYFLIPLASLVLISYATSDGDHGRQWRPWKRLHFWISLIYTATNVPHLIADILIPDSRSDQIFLMVILLLIGLLINREAWQWFRQPLPPSTIATAATDNT